MKVVLGWRSACVGATTPEARRVAADLQRLFQPLFGRPAPARILQHPAISFVELELPVRGWKAPFFEEDEQTWALAVNYPVNARTALASAGSGLPERGILPLLCRRLQRDPAPFLREMAPPFSLIWATKTAAGEAFVQNDALGMAQLFEYHDERLWALTNKITALKALGTPLEIDPEEWTVQATLGWFPLNMTGYKRIRYLDPGTRLRLDAGGLTRTRCDVLSNWVRPKGMSREECLELARTSLLRQIQAGLPLWENPTVGLSGGRDSRAVVSSLRVLGAEFDARVKGLPGRYDVVVAPQLARIAGFKLKIKHSADLPPEDPDSCRRCISLALLWQAGHMLSKKHKTFLSGREYLDSGRVNIMGQHGEIGRATWADQIRALDVTEEQCEERLIEFLLRAMPPYTRREHRDMVRQVLQQAYRQADRYELSGLFRLDFFHLYEKTRRWASGTLNAQGGLPFSPFLNPDYVRASFAYGDPDKRTSPFHSYIIAANAPDWVGVPFADELVRQDEEAAKKDGAAEPTAETGARADWKRPVGNHLYDSLLYWQIVGRPIVEDALREGGVWTRIFDPDLARKHWKVAPDQLANAYLLSDLLDGPNFGRAGAT